jgi:NADPH-dependent 2,4-dienoyl-CoA reductase/sulfur reductase-like enzyme/nitrite reductase/ring-hydroxylating ferredoxin subunit
MIGSHSERATRVPTREETTLESSELTGPDLATGIPEDELNDGKTLLGHARGEPVMLARRGDELFAVAASCTHYGGPLSEGILVGTTVRCPWHHACFDLRTGAAIRAPALNDIACWAVERREGKIVVGEKRESSRPAQAFGSQPELHPESIAIVGAGAAGNAAAEMLRREGFTGPVTVFDSDRLAPYDRPNLSKDFLAGNAPEDWIPLHPASFYQEMAIELVLDRPVKQLDAAARRLTFDDGSSRQFGAVLLATGSSPIRLDIPRFDNVEIHYLRTLEDSRALIALAGKSKHAVVLGASFIGLEVAASLCTRGLKVEIVAPGQRPLEKVLGPELGDFIRGVHEEHGVKFHLGLTAESVERGAVILSDGKRLKADLVVAGVGVTPNVQLAEAAGLAVDRGVVVDEFLETSAKGVFAAGDIARWPDARTGQRIRVEHWVVAERHGQAVARNILGNRQRFALPPFFWSNHYDVAIGYTGYAEKWDEIQVDGSIADQDCAVRYRLGGKTLALATMGRDVENLETERAMERLAD